MEVRETSGPLERAQSDVRLGRVALQRRTAGPLRRRDPPATGFETPRSVSRYAPTRRRSTEASRFRQGRSPICAERPWRTTCTEERRWPRRTGGRHSARLRAYRPYAPARRVSSPTFWRAFVRTKGGAASPCPAASSTLQRRSPSWRHRPTSSRRSSSQVATSSEADSPQIEHDAGGQA